MQRRLPASLPRFGCHGSFRAASNNLLYRRDKVSLRYAILRKYRNFFFLAENQFFDQLHKRRALLSDLMHSLAFVISSFKEFASPSKNGAADVPVLLSASASSTSSSSETISEASVAPGPAEMRASRFAMRSTKLQQTKTQASGKWSLQSRLRVLRRLPATRPRRNLSADIPAVALLASETPRQAQFPLV